MIGNIWGIGINLIIPIEAMMQVSIYCCNDRVEYNSHTPCYKALLEEFTLLPSHQEQQPLPTKPAQAHRGRVCHRAYHYNWKWHMQRWEVGGRKGWSRKGRKKRERQRGRWGVEGGVRLTDSNEIIEEAREWASEGAKQKDKKKNARDWFSGTDTGLRM